MELNTTDVLNPQQLIELNDWIRRNEAATGPASEDEMVALYKMQRFQLVLKAVGWIWFAGLLPSLPDVEFLIELDRAMHQWLDIPKTAEEERRLDALFNRLSAMTIAELYLVTKDIPAPFVAEGERGNY